MRWLLAVSLLLLPVCCPAADVPDWDLEAAGLGPWEIYGTPVILEKSPHARSGAQSLRVVTDNQKTMGGNYEGVSHALGNFLAGDLLRLSFWYDVKGSKNIVAGIGTTYFVGRWVLSGTDWTRADLVLRIPQSGKYNIWLSQESEATEFFLDDFELEVIRRPNLGEAADGQWLRLVGGPLQLTLDRETGALCGLENLATGETYAPVGRREPLLQVEVLGPGGQGVRVLPFSQFRLVGVSSAGLNSAEIRLACAEPALRVTVKINMQSDGAAVFTATVVNDSRQTVLGFELPIISGVLPAGDPEKLTLVHPYVCGQIIRNALQSDGCQTSWPGRGVMGWLDLSGEQGGIYLATHDSTMTGTRLTALPAPGPVFDLSLTREVVIAPGQTWTAPDTVLAVHEGDWHAGADRYRAWARSWMQPPDVPQWLHDDNGWLLLGVQNGIPFWRLPEYLRSAQWMGISFLHVQGQGIDHMWLDEQGKRQGHVMTYLYPTPKYGSVEDLKTAIRKIHEQAGRVMLYYLYERWTPSHHTSDNFGTGTRAEVPAAYLPPPASFYPDNALVERPGLKPPTENPFMAIRLMCLAAPGWQEWMRRWAVDVYAKEYGADGFYWDVMGRGGPFRCFNERHDHHGENQWAAGCAQVLETVTREGRKINAHYSSAIEGCSDVLGQWTGYHLMSGATLTPNVFRYTFPEYLLVDGFSNHTFKLTHVQKANRVFLDGQRFDIHGYDQRVKQRISLRRRLKPFLDWPAVFKDTVGITVSDPKVQARSFWRTEGAHRALALTMMNEAGVEGATVKVDLAPIGRPVAVHLFHLDGRVEALPPATGPTQTVPVPPEEISAALLVAAVGPSLQVVSWLEQIMRPGEDGMTLTLLYPDGRPRPAAITVNWPADFDPTAASVPTASPAVQVTEYRDPAHLAGLKRWERVMATVTWGQQQAQPWAMLCPPLVNGDFEESEDGRLAYWGAKPWGETVGKGQSCLRLAAGERMLSSLTPLKPATRYRLRGMLQRPAGATGLVGAHVIEYEEGSKFVRSAELNCRRTGEWETLEIEFTTHPNPRSTAIYLYNFNDATPAYYDGLHLEEVR